MAGRVIAAGPDADGVARLCISHPAKLNALFRIEGSMIADNGFACDGSGYIATTGGTPVLEVAGGGMVLSGGLGAVFNARPARTWRG